MPRIGHWCKADNEKLQGLLEQRGNGINANRGKENIERIAKHWPERISTADKKKTFFTLLRGKLEKFEISGSVTGRRAGEFIFLLCIYFVCHTLSLS